MPAEARRLLAHADRRSESFAESVLRARLLRSGIPCRIQVVIGEDRVDFLLGERLVIEVDGKEFHTDERWFERDRSRDARLSVRGCRVLRFSYAQVVYRWPEVEAAIRAALWRGDHL
jgi:very-short-patch-repair endonuclease